MIRQLLKEAELELKKSTVLDPNRNTKVEAEDIFLSVLRARGLEMVLDLYTSRAESLTQTEQEEIQSRLARRIQGQSLHYVTGERDFLSSRYEIIPGVLVPRPETEVLVVKTIEAIKKKNWVGLIRGFELGVGSGAISIELLKAVSKLTMTATEISSAAFELAKRNAESVLENEHHRFKLIHQKNRAPEIIEDEPYQFFVSNPPYLHPSDEIDSEVLNNEPSEALFPVSGNPNEFYEYFANEGQRFLVGGGFCMVEVPHNRAEVIAEFFQKKLWKDVKTISDLTNRPRFVYAEKPEE